VSVAEDWLWARRVYSAVYSIVYVVADKEGGANGSGSGDKGVAIRGGLRRRSGQ
jgi:hypothetical protein